MSQEKVRMTPDARVLHLLGVALHMAETEGYRNLTGPRVASAAGIKGHGLINYYFGSVERMKATVLTTAIERGNLEILLQGLVTKDPIALNAPVSLRQAAYEKLRAE